MGKSKKPTFSIIVPIYNVEKYLSKCIESILAQSNRDFELIAVVDVSSNDKSEEIVDSFVFRDNRMVKIEREHKGLSDARNIGIEKACGRYLIFVDSDDYFANDDYLEAINKRIKDEETDYIITKYQKCNEDGSEPIKIGKTINDNVINNRSSKAKMISIINSGEFRISAWGKAIRKEFLQENNLYFVDGYSEDIDWTSRIINLANGIELTNNDGYVHRVRSDSLSKEGNIHQWADLWKRLKAWDDLIRDGSEEFHNAQRGYLAYEFYILLACSHWFNRKKRKRLKPKIMELSHLMRYSHSSKTRKCKILCTILGMELGGALLYSYINLKKY